MNTTSKDLKRWSLKSRRLALAVCAAQANAELTREKVDKYVGPIFGSFDFKFCGDMAERAGIAGQPVPNPGELYLCEDPRITDYYAACDREHGAQGYDLKPGYCPALVAEMILIDAQNALIDSAKPLFGVEVCDLHKDNHRAEYLKLLIGSCLVGPSPRRVGRAGQASADSLSGV